RWKEYFEDADRVGIFFENHDVTIAKRRDIIPGRLLLIDYLYLGHKFRFINVYTAPERTKKMQLFKKLREIVNVAFNLILWGDFNTVTEDQDRIAVTPFQIALKLLLFHSTEIFSKRRKIYTI
uniref:Endonuclease/exonuclease/phosphatase domain-containing protein n=1 Tax=Mola mola TaxID=94237 RepID=A0A3Q3WQ38_MOLML